MAVSKGRNEVQASIEDNAQSLIALSEDINIFFKLKIIDITKNIDEIKECNTGLEIDELHSSLCSYSQMKEIYEVLYIESMEMIVSKVYSYAEKHLFMLAERVKCNRNDILKVCRDDNFSHGKSEIEKVIYAINKKCSSSKICILDYWRDYKEIHELRVNIEHHYNYIKQLVSIEYIFSNISQVEALLNAVEKITAEVH